MNKLIECKTILRREDDVYLETTNKKTGWVGCASFYTNGEEKIYVNEGDSSGSDDAGYTYEEFLQKYDFKLKHEF